MEGIQQSALKLIAPQGHNRQGNDRSHPCG